MVSPCEFDHRGGPRTWRRPCGAPLDRGARDHWTAATVNVEGDAHAPQLLDLASLAMEPCQQRKLIGIQEHRRCSDCLNRTQLAGLYSTSTTLTTQVHRGNLLAAVAHLATDDLPSLPIDGLLLRRELL